MKTAYIKGIILDGTEQMEPRQGQVLFVEDKHISAIVPEAEADLNGCQVVDLGGRYILPGLINLHVHLPGTGKPTKKPMNLKGLCRLITSCALCRSVGRSIVAANARQALMAGVTTLRTVGSIGDFDSRVRDDIKEGRRVGPRLLAANCAISVPGGHMAGTFAYEAHSAEEAAALVDRIAADGPDLIKLMVTGGIMDGDTVGEPGVLRMPETYIKAACDRAHKLGYRVAAHCEGPDGVRAALKNGVDTIEHGAKPDSEMMGLFRERGACQVLTLSPAIPYVKRMKGLFNLSEAAVINSTIVLEGMAELARACLKAGIPVGLGTDSSCTYVTQYDMWRELVSFTEYCGVTNRFALHTATLVNAQIAGIADRTGSIEPGKLADLIVVEDNPLENLQTLRRVNTVIFEGRRFDSPRVKKIAVVEDALDGIS